MQSKWPVLSYSEGRETFETVHMWTQIVGKIKIALLPWINHSWHVTLHPSSKGLTTGPVAYLDYNFEIEFDFINHQLIISTSKNESRKFSFLSLSVRDFYYKIFDELRALNINVKIKPVPVEIANPIPFADDTVHHTYDEKQISAFHNALVKITEVFLKFRSGFMGKCSPIHFFWGSFDLALSFFSGRKAPKHPGGIPGLPDWVAAEAYNREVSSCGFWPGNESYPHPAFYCYLYPEPNGYKTATIKPSEAFYNRDLGEFILPYDVVQKSNEGDLKLIEFLKSTYEEGANLANWDREILEVK